MVSTMNTLPPIESPIIHSTSIPNNVSYTKPVFYLHAIWVDYMGIMVVGVLAPITSNNTPSPRSQTGNTPSIVICM